MKLFEEQRSHLLDRGHPGDHSPSASQSGRLDETRQGTPETPLNNEKDRRRLSARLPAFIPKPAADPSERHSLHLSVVQISGDDEDDDDDEFVQLIAGPDVCSMPQDLCDDSVYTHR